MRVAVIVPCYRQAAFLPEAIESVRAQRGAPEHTVTVVAGGPEEAAAARALGVDDVIERAPRGLADARNVGIRAHPEADAFLPLDADDALEPTALAELEAATPLARPLFITSPDAQECGDRKNLWRLPPLENLAEQNALCCCSLVSRKLWGMAGGYDPTTVAYEDWDFWLRCMRFSPYVTQLRRAVFRYRIHEGTLSSAHATHEPLWRAMIQLRHPDRYAPRRLAEARRLVAGAPAEVKALLAERRAWFPSELPPC